MRSLLLVSFLVACGGGDDGVTPGSDARTDGPPSDEGMVPEDMRPLEGSPLIDIGTVELVKNGYMFVEGPQWREAEGDFLFTDIPDNRIWRLQSDGNIFAHISNSGGANGLAIHPNGAVVSARHTMRNIVRGSVIMADMFEGKPFNSPNDVVVAANGNYYFTDPPYGLPAGTPSAQGFMGVFRLSPTGTVTALHRGALTERPNGVAISPDSTTLYVADTAASKIYTFSIEDSPVAAAREEFITTANGPDGMAVDEAGNLFIATSIGVEAYSPEGVRWGVIAVPEVPSNCAFGDPDHKTLYITARTGLYRVRLANAGLPTH